MVFLKYFSPDSQESGFKKLLILSFQKLVSLSAFQISIFDEFISGTHLIIREGLGWF